MGVSAAGYWEQVRRSGFEVPTDRPLDALTTELIGMIGDPDPAIRDGIALPALTAWVGTGVFDDLLAGFGDGVSEGMFVGLGDADTDSVLRRSCSALLLSAVVERGDNAGVVHPDALVRWGDRAASWFVRERDLRGYIEHRGRAHAIAHGADLIGALARCQPFGKLELTVLLDVVADRLLTPTPYRFVHAEDDRLAYAVMAILHRGEVGVGIIEPWVERLLAGLLPPSEADASDGMPPEWPTPAAGNTAAFLRSLHLQLALGVKPGTAARDTELFERPPPHRADLLLILIRALRRSRPRLFADPGPHGR